MDTYRLLAVSQDVTLNIFSLITFVVGALVVTSLTAAWLPVLSTNPLRRANRPACRPVQFFRTLCKR